LPLEQKQVQFASANDFPLIEARNEIQQLREAVAALGIEKELMDSKAKTLEERLAREKLIAEKENSLVKFAIENEMHCRVMQFREGIWREKLGFRGEVAAKLKLEGLPCDEDAVLKAVAEVAERLTRAEAEGDELRESGGRLRRLLNCSSFAEAVERVSALWLPHSETREVERRQPTSAQYSIKLVRKSESSGKENYEGTDHSGKSIAIMISLSSSAGHEWPQPLSTPCSFHQPRPIGCCPTRICSTRRFCSGVSVVLLRSRGCN
jgi:hypothetical protein